MQTFPYNHTERIMTPAVEELIQKLNQNGGRITVSKAANFKIGTTGSSLDFRKRLYALERHGYIILSGEIIQINPAYEVKPQPTLVERLANYLMQAFEQSKNLTISAITVHLKELSNEFKMAGARRKKMIEDAMADLRRRGIELKEELVDGLRRFTLVGTTA